MRTVLRSIVLALALTALVVGAGLYLTGADDEEPAPEPPAYEPTSLSSYDTSVVAIARAGFCDRLPAEAIVDALDGEPTTETSYGNGEAVPGFDDVAHEFGCWYEGADGTEARAWVFAPPVTRERAAELVEDASGLGSCERQGGAPAYGDPTVALICPAGDRRVTSFRGLFGDAWLVCSVAAPAGLGDQELLDRAGRWCVAVAEAASGH